MIEDDGKYDPQEADEHRDGEALLYDLGKFLTTLSLLAIGGVLTIADSSRVDVKPAGIAIITVVLATAAVLACTTASSIAYSRYTGEPIRTNLKYLMMATMALLGMGLGMFLYTWIAKLN